MKPYQLVLIGATLALALGGCGGSNSNSTTQVPPPPPPPPPPATTSFTSFVGTVLASTSDTTEPVDVNGVNFTFPDNDNPAAFNNVVGSP